MKNKKALSMVVTSLIIILLVLVAIGIIWIVVKKILSEGTEQVYLGKFTMNLEIKSIKVNENDVEVIIKRNTGAGELAGINFVVNDGVNTQVFEESTTMGELGSQSFTIPYDGLVKEISIAPVFETSSGKKSIGNEIDKEVLSNKQIIENLGGVSWWKLDGNANDEVGGNHGILNNGVDCSVSGKFGRACSFDGGWKKMNLTSPFSKTGYITIALWYKQTNSGANNWRTLIGSVSDNIHHLIIQSPGTGPIGIWDGGFRNFGYIPPNDGNFHNYVIVYNNALSAALYVDGNYKNQVNTNLNFITYPIGSIGNWAGGYYWAGLIDEPMIFNRALTEDEIKALYELDLG